MFFESSSRSVRTMHRRSPTRSARCSPAAAAASPAPTSRSDGASGPNVVANAPAPSPLPRSCRQSRNAWTQCSVWNPAGAAVSDAKISSVTASGQHRQLARRAERRVREVRDRDVGPQLGELAGTRSSCRSWTSTTSPGAAVVGHRLGEGPVDDPVGVPGLVRARRRTPAHGRSRTGRGSRTRGSGSRSRRSGAGGSRDPAPAARPRGRAPTPRRRPLRRGRRRRSRPRSRWRRRGRGAAGRARSPRHRRPAGR